MRIHRSLIRSTLAALVVALSAHSAAAQSNVFVTGTGFADIKRFDRVVYDPLALATDSDPFSLDATGAGGGLRVGTFLHPRWSLELAVDAGNATKRNFPNPYDAIIARSTSLRIPELSSSTRFLSVSTVIGFHSRKMARVRLGYLAGFSFVRATHESELPYFIALDDSVATAIATFTFPSASIVPTIFPPPPFTTRTTRRIDNAPGVVLGFETAIDVASRLAVVPEVRALAFSTTGRDVFVVRPGVGVRWSF